MARMKELEEENRRLKKRYVEARLRAEIVAEALTNKMVAPSQRREMAQWAVLERSATVKPACQAFGISQTCYRYKAKLDAENNLIADWLVRLTNSQHNWGVGLCFRYLPNVKGFKWNHKRVYRIYRELEMEPADQTVSLSGARETAAVGNAECDQSELVNRLHA